MADNDPKAAEAAKAEQATQQAQQAQTPQQPPKNTPGPSPDPKAAEATKAYDASRVIDGLRKSGTGKSKLEALAAIKAKGKADWYEAARRVVPSGTLRKIEKLLG